MLMNLDLDGLRVANKLSLMLTNLDLDGLRVANKLSFMQTNLDSLGVASMVSESHLRLSID